MSAGFCSSTSVCHSTICQRSGSEAKALAAAAFSKPSTAVSWNGTPGSNGVEVVGRVQPRPGPDPVDVEPAYGGQQVGAEGEVGPAAALEHGEDLGERVGDQVVGVRRPDQLAGQPAGGVDVAREQLAVGVDVAAADAPRSARRRSASRSQEIGHGARWDGPHAVMTRIERVAAGHDSRLTPNPGRNAG